MVATTTARAHKSSTDRVRWHFKLNCHESPRLRWPGNGLKWAGTGSSSLDELHPVVQFPGSQAQEDQFTVRKRHAVWTPTPSTSPELLLFVHRKFKGPRKRPTMVPANKSQNPELFLFVHRKFKGPRKRPNFPATTSSKFSSITMSRGGSHSCQRRGARTRQPPFTALVLTSQTSCLLPLTHDKCIQPAVWRISCEQLLEMGESRSQRRHLPHKRSGDHVATA